MSTLLIGSDIWSKSSLTYSFISHPNQGNNYYNEHGILHSSFSNKLDNPYSFHTVETNIQNDVGLYLKNTYSSINRVSFSDVANLSFSYACTGAVGTIAVGSAELNNGQYGIGFEPFLDSQGQSAFFGDIWLDHKQGVLMLCIKLLI